jgi:hypothetical protein
MIQSFQRWFNTERTQRMILGFRCVSSGLSLLTPLRVIRLAMIVRSPSIRRNTLRYSALRGLSRLTPFHVIRHGMIVRLQFMRRHSQRDGALRALKLLGPIRKIYTALDYCGALQLTPPIFFALTLLLSFRVAVVELPRPRFRHSWISFNPRRILASRSGIQSLFMNLSS